MLMLHMHVCLPLLLLLLLVLALPHVPVGWHEDVTREVVLQQVSRDWHAMALSIGRGHGGAVGLSQAGTPRGVHPICACPPVMPLLSPTTLMRRRKPICIYPPLLSGLSLTTSVCAAISQEASCCRICCGARSKGFGPVGTAEPSSVQVTIQLFNVAGQDVISWWHGCGCCNELRRLLLARQLLLILPLLIEG